MKTIFTLCFTIAIFICGAQNINRPNSVAYSAQLNRYFVSQVNSPNILSVRPGQTPTVFASSVTNPIALAISGDTLYVCHNNSYLKAFNINTGQAIFNVSTGTPQLTSMCPDNAGSIYLTTAAVGLIIRFNPFTMDVNNFCFAPRSLNAIAFDSRNQRLIAGSSGLNALVCGISLSDSTLTTLDTTTLSNIRSISIDRYSNVYIGSDIAGGEGIYEVDSGFSLLPAKIISFPSGSYHGLATFNQAHDTLAVTDRNNNQVLYFGFRAPSSISDHAFATADQSKTFCVLGSDTTIGSFSVVLSAVFDPQSGSASISDNCIEYTPSTAGRDTIIYLTCIEQVSNYCSFDTLFITNLDSADNHAPMAEDDVAEIVWLDTLSVNVVLNDLDVEGDSMCVQGIIGSSRFSLNSANCNNIIYATDTFFIGNDTCHYIVCDNDTLPLCDTAMLVVKVTADSSLFPHASFDFRHDNILCYEVKVVNTTPNDTGTARWEFRQLNHQPYVMYGDTVYYLNTNNYWFYGDVCLFVSNQYGIDSVCQLFSSFCIGINEAIGLNAFAIVPNPVSDKLNLTLDVSESGTFAFVIESADGRLLFETVAEYLNAGQHNKSIAISLANGIYLVGCKTDGGTVYQKVLVQH